MLKSPYLFAISVLVTLIHWTNAAKAQDLNLGLSFELPPTQAKSITPTAPPAVSSTHIEIAAIAQPTATDSVALSFAANTVSIETLPASNPTLDAEDKPAASLPLGEAISFSPTDSASSLDDWIFENGTHSLVARTVGSAEGTRKTNGQRTQAYYGHTDPGNGVWNLGTFSYQHEARSPEDADEKQLRRLKKQGFELEEQATRLGIRLSLIEKLNGLDLANQAPLAALDTGGYIDRLAQAKRLQMKGDEAILWARTHAYIDPNTRRWNAPGLGNNIHSISEDQDRRIAAIASAFKAYSPRNINLASLASLQEVSLSNTGADTLPTLVETAAESEQSIFGSVSTDERLIAELSDLEVSFGLPSVRVEDITEEPVLVVEALALPAPTVVSSIEQNERSVEDTSVPDIGVAFSPTENIADSAAVATLTEEEGEIVEDNKDAAQVEALETEATDIGTVDTVETQIEEAQIEEAQIETVKTEIADLGRAETISDLETAETIAVDVETIENSASTDRAAQLQSLLSDVNVADPELLEALKNSQASDDSEAAKQFFRTEDKIVQSK